MAYTGPVEDRLAVRELIESYAGAVTTRDVAGWSALWAEDAVWEMPALGVTVAGRDEIVALWRKMMIKFHGPEEAPWAFSFLSIPREMAIMGDRATVSSTSVEAFADEAGKTVQLLGQYEDEAVRVDGIWLFARRSWRLMPLLDAGLFLDA